MRSILVGYSGFVGSNLSSQFSFEGLFNSRTVEEAFGAKPELLVYSGVKAEKFFADSHPAEDEAHINQAFRNIERIEPDKLVLISTIDVYGKDIRGMDETACLDPDNLKPYGSNRLKLELMVRNRYKNCLILRLPALYGNNLKKNFIYDFINSIPNKLSTEMYRKLGGDGSLLDRWYFPEKSGYYQIVNSGAEQKEELKAYFRKLGFSALNFTDSRNVYQFYNLSWLKKHLLLALEQDLRVVNIVSEPVGAAELYQYLTGKEFRNEFLDFPLQYNITSCHAEALGGSSGYLASRTSVMEDIRMYVNSVVQRDSGNRKFH